MSEGTIKIFTFIVFIIPSFLCFFMADVVGGFNLMHIIGLLSLALACGSLFLSYSDGGTTNRHID